MSINKIARGASVGVFFASGVVLLLASRVERLQRITLVAKGALALSVAGFATSWVMSPVDMEGALASKEWMRSKLEASDNQTPSELARAYSSHLPDLFEGFSFETTVESPDLRLKDDKLFKMDFITGQGRNQLTFEGGQGQLENYCVEKLGEERGAALAVELKKWLTQRLGVDALADAMKKFPVLFYKDDAKKIWVGLGPANVKGVVDLKIADRVITVETTRHLVSRNNLVAEQSRAIDLLGRLILTSTLTLKLKEQDVQLQSFRYRITRALDR